MARQEILNGQTGASVRDSLNSMTDELYRTKVDVVDLPVSNDIVILSENGGISDSGKSFSTDGSLSNNSDFEIPTVRAVKTYSDTKVTANLSIVGATKTKVSYDSKGLITNGSDATTADIADSTNKRYVTDNNLAVIVNTSGVNSGDETNSSIITKIGYTPVNKAGDTMSGALIAPSINVTGQSVTQSAFNILAGSQKYIPTSGDFENNGRALLYTKSGATKTTIPGVLYTANAAQVIANTTTETTLFAPKTATGIVGISNSTTVTGTNTLFTTELQVGALIRVGTERRIVTSIVSNTSLTVGTAFTQGSLSGQTLTYKSTVIRANDLYSGAQIRIKMSGIVSTGSPTSSATLYLKLIKGDGTETALNTVSEGLANNMTNYYFDKDIVLTCRTTGETGTIIHQGRSQLCKSDGANFSMLPLTATTPTTVDTTVDQFVELSFKWAAANASNTITVSNSSIEMIGGVL